MRVRIHTLLCKLLSACFVFVVRFDALTQCFFFYFLFLFVFGGIPTCVFCNHLQRVTINSQSHISRLICELLSDCMFTNNKCRYYVLSIIAAHRSHPLLSIAHVHRCQSLVPIAHTHRYSSLIAIAIHRSHPSLISIAANRSHPSLTQTKGHRFAQLRTRFRNVLHNCFFYGETTATQFRDVSRRENVT